MSDQEETKVDQKREAGGDVLPYLWADLTPEEQEKLLRDVEAKLQRSKDRPAFPPGSGNRYRPEEWPQDVYDEMEALFGSRLDDGWYRIIALHKVEGLLINLHERFEADWLRAYSKEYKATAAMRHWPKRARNKGNPWKATAVFQIGLSKVERVGEEQFKVTFSIPQEKTRPPRFWVPKEMRPPPPEDLTQTYYFLTRYKPSGLGGGWVVPRIQSFSKPITDIPRLMINRKAFGPALTEDDKKRLRASVKEIRRLKAQRSMTRDDWRALADADSVKTQTIIALRKRHPEAVPITCKEVVERFLKMVERT